MAFSRLTFSSLIFAASLSLLSACGGGGGSDAGYQDDDTPPEAIAGVLGLGASVSTTEKMFVARANSQATLTGKDSDSDVAPILKFEWKQTDGQTTTLIERTANSVAFNTPDVASEETFTFELTVTDANGKSDTDSLSITVIPVSDQDRFLSDPNTPPSELTLLAALRGGESTGNAEQLFSIEVATIVHWVNRLGEAEQLRIDTRTIDGSFPKNFSPAVNYAPLSEPRNPLLTIELLRLNADDINQNFETSERDRRLETYNIPTAYLEIQLTINSSSVDFEMYALTRGGDLIDSDTVETQTNSPAIGNSDSSNKKQLAAQEKQLISINKLQSPVNSFAAANGALLQSWQVTPTASLLTTNILKQLGLESTISANAYYNLIDPDGQLTTLSNWQKNAGFIDASGAIIRSDEISKALYVNNYDLGFGRDMYLRKAPNGNVYSYVVNYPTIEAGMEQNGEFAAVAMEYSENPDPDGANAKIVKFFVYVFDERSGDFIRVGSLNFDGSGEKFVPGVCTICHQSNPGNRDYSEVADADLNATFLPWDLDSFLYSHALDPKIIEPSLNASLFSAAKIDQFSKESQEAELRKLNLGALATYIDNPERYEASIELIHGWYGDPDVELPIDELPNQAFDGDYVPAGWVGQEDLYRNVVSRTCRICHTQLANKPNNFDSYEKFLDKKDRIIDYVYSQGIMPAARLSMDRFWVDFNGSGTSSADLLRAHLVSIGETVQQTPGLPVPDFSFSPAEPSIDDTIILDATNSIFSNSFSWSLTTPNGSTASLSNSTGLNNLFSADIPGGTYSVTLTALNTLGQQASISKDIVIQNRTPVAECFNVNTAALASSTVLNTIATTANITARGDGGIRISSIDSGSFGTATINNDGQTFAYQLDNPFNRGVDVIEYQLSDIDGSLSTTSSACNTSPRAGFATITIDSTPAGTTATQSATATVDAVNNTTEIDLSWVAVTAITIDGYNVYRNASATGAPLNSSLITGTNFSDDNNGAGLTAGTTYNYSVTTVVGGVNSNPTNASAATASLTPTAVTADNSGTDDNTTDINISWTAPAAGAATIDEYRVYRDTALIQTITDDSTTLADGKDTADLTPGTSYSYRVTAFDGIQESPLSNTANESTTPLAPINLNLSAGTDGRSDIDLDWDNPGGNVDVYGVYRNGAKITEVASSQFTDSGLTPNMTYTYHVTALVNSGGLLEQESLPSDDPGLDQTTLPAGADEATNLAAALDGTEDATHVVLSWDVPAAFTDEGYNIYRSTNDGAYTLLGAQPTVTALATSYSDNASNAASRGYPAVANSTKYEYKIAAIFNGDEQSQTAENVALATATTNSLEATSIAIDLANTSNSQIRFTWTSPIANEDDYLVERSNDGGSSFTVSVESSTTNEFAVDTDSLSAATTYIYQITANQGADSGVATASLSTAPNVPQSLTATLNGANGDTQIDLAWSAPASGSVDSYNIYRSSDGSGSAIANVLSTDPLVYADTGRTPGNSYDYTIKAVYDGVESAISNTDSELTRPSAPSAVVASSKAPGDTTLNKTTRTDISWGSVVGADGYNIYRNGSKINGGTPVVGTSFEDSGLTGGINYSYIVRAVLTSPTPDLESYDSLADSAATYPEAPSVSALTETETGANSLTINWSANNDGSATYRVYFNGTAQGSNTAVDATSATISGLNSNTTYSNITVRATANSLSSEDSTPGRSADTDVTLTDIAAQTFFSQPIGEYAQTCDGACHTFTTSRAKAACLINDGSLNDCDAVDMAPRNYTIDATERALLIEFAEDNP
ncbi:fibronectin type III domain-containing protein [Oceanicoccus sp. KOV_DT_Chl]|uniref:fibronectin type III domain-containing protein n=1 Tax=Oceanicoccus sp. KOV_DT_Chl TaxID=1904639 RepID=UPI000C7D1160|nr:fibronectin type III domain-containing protein [Oceanicoccus sp. KOV_DT_Chl]